MPSFVASVNLGTVGDDITSVKLYACTDSSCTSCVSLSGYTSVLVSSFPRNIGDIPIGTTNIKVESIGRCNVSQCISIVGIPTATPTPTATNTPTPTPTPTSTPIPPTSTPIPPTSTPTPIGPTSTPTSTPTNTPTPTPTPNCNFNVDISNSTPTPTPTATPTPSTCLIYNLSVSSGTSADFSYVDCNGNAANILVPSGDNPSICSLTTPYVIGGNGSVINTNSICAN